MSIRDRHRHRELKKKESPKKSGWERFKSGAGKVVSTAKVKMEERRAFNASPAGKKAAKERAARAKRMMAALNSFGNMGSSGGGGGGRSTRKKKKSGHKKTAYKTVTYYR